jgi:DNA-binding transcriptional MerR regulator
MRIGELAHHTGVSAKTLRFYEARRLLPDPGRTAAGQRDYPPEAVARVRFIKRAQAAGLTLAQIATVLAARDEGRAPCADVRALADDRLADVERRLDELSRVRASLRQLQARADTLDPGECDPSAVCVAVPDGQG